MAAACDQEGNSRWAPSAKEEALRHSERKTKITTTLLALALLVGWSASPALAQAPPCYSPEQLDRLVSRIALYPDPLLAQLLAAATFSDQIPDAAKWADEHHYLTGDEAWPWRGVCAALTGAHTWCSSTTRLGDVSGPTAASMCILTASCTGGSPHTAWKGTG